MELKEAHKQQLRSKGISLEQLNQQIENFIKGFPKAQLIEAATIGKGIHAFNEDEATFFVEVYRNLAAFYKISKFVPASGAASRMFKHLFQAMDEGENINKDAKEFMDHLSRFPFYTQLKDVLKQDGLSIDELYAKSDYSTILMYLLTDKGLNYGKLPKALISFHQNEERVSTAIEEQLFEACLHLGNSENNIRLHFTVSPEHTSLIETLLTEKGSYYEEKFNRLFEIVLTNQSPSTDTIAVNMDNTAFEQNGQLLFRPGGHGALIYNLNKEESELVFIKNIDNVSPEPYAIKNAYYKELLGGVLLFVQNQLYDFLRQLEGFLAKDGNIEFEHSDLKQEIALFYSDFFHKQIAINDAQMAFEMLNKPLRVCGMVKNEGEPGGGPFWVKVAAESSLQIVESSEIDLEDKAQKNIFLNSTHFNPVDIVCGLYNYKGEKFDLLEYRNSKAGFIAQKSVNGADIKALELPGLWNGAMAFWNTIFVEVPISTFNPVKSVNDLLKPNHN